MKMIRMKTIKGRSRKSSIERRRVRRTSIRKGHFYVSRVDKWLPNIGRK
jgi:hypothetical protein